MDTYAKLKELEQRIAALEARPEAAAELRVDFASATATEMAAAADLSRADFANTSASGATGFTADDVRDVKKKRTKRGD